MITKGQGAQLATFNFSDKGGEALRSHMKGKKHSQKVAPVQCLF